MAKWLVPLMHRYALVRNLVWHTMVSPLTKYGMFITRQQRDGRKYRIHRKFWFSIWNFLGKER